jgi:hypothetical protein
MALLQVWSQGADGQPNELVGAVEFNAGHGDTFNTTNDAELHNLMEWALAIEAGAATIEDVDALRVPEWSRRSGRVPSREESWTPRPQS